MISKTHQSITTAEQLLDMPDDGNRYELVNGVVNMMSPAGSEHGRVAARIGARLLVHVEKHNLGIAYAAETGFRISTSPDTVRAPDAAFVSHERLASVEPTRGYLPLAPDLVVEVISPDDRFSEVETKASDWLSAGTEIVLVTDPENLVLKVYANDSDIRTLQPGETFSAGDVCGNWQLAVNDAFQI